MPFGNPDCESQRDSGSKPGVARHELPWEKRQKKPQPQRRPLPKERGRPARQLRGRKVSRIPKDTCGRAARAPPPTGLRRVLTNAPSSRPDPLPRRFRPEWFAPACFAGVFPNGITISLQGLLDWMKVSSAGFGLK